MWFSIIGCLLLLVVYACTTHIGRVLKRRWGVKLGGEFHMLCVAISFRVGFIFFPHDTNEQGMLKLITISQDILNFLSAAMVILGTLFIVKMVNRFYWEGYFQKKRQMVVPRFLTHSTMLLGLLASVLAVMQFIYGVKLQGLFVGGAIGTAGIALALQSILKNLFAGFTLQFDKPYKPGDWLLVEGDMGQVMEINWRSTRMRTIDHIYLDLPNADMISNKIINLNYPVRLHAFRLQIPADYSSPPNQVREILMDSVGHVDGIRKDPPPEVFVKDFDDRAAIYEIKYWLDEDEKMDRVADAIRTGA
jgi:small-conductance mechanosensitive channel